MPIGLLHLNENKELVTSFEGIDILQSIHVDNVLLVG